MTRVMDSWIWSSKKLIVDIVNSEQSIIDK